MTTEALETRVVRLELQTKNHAENIKELREEFQETTASLKATMESIKSNLTQIKYTAIGALAVVLGQSFGVDKVIKLLFGV